MALAGRTDAVAAMAGAHDPPRLATGDEVGRTAAKRDMRVDGGARQHQPEYCKAVRTTFTQEWARGICRHAHCVLIFAYERQR